MTRSSSDRTGCHSDGVLKFLAPSIVINQEKKSLQGIMRDTNRTQVLNYYDSSCDDDEDTCGDATYDSDDIIESYERQDNCTEFVAGKKEQQKECIFRELRNIEVPKFLKKKQELQKKKKVIRLKKMLLNPVKSLVSKTSTFEKKAYNRPRSNSDPFTSNTSSTNTSNLSSSTKPRLQRRLLKTFLQGDKRRRVSFGEEVQAPPSGTPAAAAAAIQDYTLEEMEAMWYNKDEYETMKQEALKAPENFIENGQRLLTLGGTTTKEMIVERKRYKVASRFVVFDEQEEQRMSKRRDPEKVRMLYSQASIRSLEVAQKTAANDEKELRLSWMSLDSDEDD